MSFSKDTAEKKELIEQYIKTEAERLTEVTEPLKEAMLYSLLDGGKRLRPIIFLEVLNMYNKTITDSDKKFAVAIECIHTYSLIHDDLPCMDDDDLRRGKPTSHIKFGEANAILAGDALLNFAYELVFLAASESDDPLSYARAGAYLSAAAGSQGMISGQVMDIKAQNDKAMENTMTRIIKLKTGELISAAAVSAAIIAGADRDELNIIKDYAMNFGHAFQIRDDIMDYKQQPKAKDKNNYVFLYGMTVARTTLADYISKALNALNLIDKDTSFFKKLAVKSADRKE